MEVPFVDPTHEHAHVPICTHMYTQRHIHTESLQMNLFYWPKLPRNKRRRKETNSQGDTISMGKKKIMRQKYFKYTYLHLHKTFCKVSNENFKNRNRKIMYVNIQSQYSKLALRIANRKLKMHQKTDIQICKCNCLSFLVALRSAIYYAVNNIKSHL